ncbi:FAD-dependent oxidoreductase [Kutzneria sp. CA-103260]|uniref:FAD-dependent oxidoreductase n=1 Tax=Kutzneria sp. CA-103260 TaxID=2802641 RepID=UPI001BA63D13|nr:FAD-dependent oxidoreductase [Kutzneria sp. CA-103260]QUQ63929.1 3-phenylpropionate/cinnamic acid dioxygenase ferredoxin--NAD(+) reductase component [Kutzneria sp. CA-103260]
MDVESRTVTSSDGQVDYDELVVATGVRPRQLPGAGGVSGVHYVRTLEDVLALKESLRPERRLIVVVDGDIGSRRFVAAYRRGDRLTGVVAVNTAPKVLRSWRTAVADRRPWREIQSTVEV